MHFDSLTELSDADLLMRTKKIAERECSTTAALVALLIEIDNRRLFLEQGHSSLFGYCTRALHLSEHAAYNRIEAARAARRFPVILDALQAGDVHLTAVRLLSPLFTTENHRDLLRAARHKSRREVEGIIARLRPQPDVPASVRRLPAAPIRLAADEGARGSDSGAILVEPAGGRDQHVGLTWVATSLSSPGDPAANVPDKPRANASTSGEPLVSGDHRPRGAVAGDQGVRGTVAAGGTVAPLAPGRYKIQFTANGATHEKLRRAQELLRHQIPDGDLGEVIDRALDALVRVLEKRKFAATTRPRTLGRPAAAARASETKTRVAAAAGPRNAAMAREADANGAGLRIGEFPGWDASRRIPAEVRRAVWARDQGRCTFMGPNGVRCDAHGALEFDHIQPHADGGAATLDNIRLLCRRHNQYEARLFFGVWHADSTARRGAPRV